MNFNHCYYFSLYLLSNFYFIFLTSGFFFFCYLLLCVVTSLLQLLMNICITQQLLFTEFSSLDLLPQNDTPKSALSMTAGLFFYLLSDNKDMQRTISQIALISSWGHRNRRDLQKFISKALKHCMGHIIPGNKNHTFCDKR